jgi:hypothetical protein
MKKKLLLDKLERAWLDFKDSYAGLTDAQMIQPGVTEDWSVKDILAHVSLWEQESLEHLPTILQGLQPPRYSQLYGGINAFNDLMSEKRRGLSLSEVRARLDETHLKLIAYLQSVPEEQVTTETRFRRRLRLDTYSHYPLHARAIREWRERSA